MSSTSSSDSVVLIRTPTIRLATNARGSLMTPPFVQSLGCAGRRRLVPSRQVPPGRAARGCRRRGQRSAWRSPVGYPRRSQRHDPHWPPRTPAPRRQPHRSGRTTNPRSSCRMARSFEASGTRPTRRSPTGSAGRSASSQPPERRVVMRSRSPMPPTTPAPPSNGQCPLAASSDALPLLLLTTASLRAGAAVHPDGNWDVRRFRPNLLIDTEADGWVEDEWCGQTVRVGDVELLPQRPCAALHDGDPSAARGSSATSTSTRPWPSTTPAPWGSGQRFGHPGRSEPAIPSSSSPRPGRSCRSPTTSRSDEVTHSRV